MRLSRLINLTLIAVGAVASAKTLRRRVEWERGNNRAHIVLDYDDALAIATRAGLPLAEFFAKAKDHGATHVSLPELTLDRLMREGRLAVLPIQSAQAVGDAGLPMVLASADYELIDHVTGEFQDRLPWTQPEESIRWPQHGLPLMSGDSAIVSITGHLPALAEMGLGFDARAAAQILSAGLGVVPRPVSFSWPEDHLIELTLAQAAGLGAEIVAFDGDLILGHEMHLDKTVECLERHDLAFAFFSQTRHQKGDWFIAKRRASQGKVVLAHYFTPQAMVPEDFHSAAHHWGMLARARGIRLCYVHAFRRIHATEPLECLHYVEHIKEELEEIGLVVGDRRGKSLVVSRQSSDSGGQPSAVSGRILEPPDRGTLALVGLASAGAVSLAVSETLRPPAPLASGLAVLGAAGAAALPYLDRPRGRLEESYPPSYAPKLLALAGAASAPIAATAFGGEPWAASLAGAVVQAGVAASLAALTTGQDYQQHIEEYRSLNVDLFLPLAAALFRNLDGAQTRLAAFAALGAAWVAANRLAPDVLGRLDLDLPAGHTHHLSAAQRMIGDALIALGPRPARKWAGLGLAAGVVTAATRGANGESGRSSLSLAASLAAALGDAMMLAAFRRPERPLKETLPVVARSWAVGAVAGTALAAVLGAGRRRA